MKINRFPKRFIFTVLLAAVGASALQVWGQVPVYRQSNIPISPIGHVPVNQVPWSKVPIRSAADSTGGYFQVPVTQMPNPQIQNSQVPISRVPNGQVPYSSSGYGHYQPSGYVPAGNIPGRAGQGADTPLAANGGQMSSSRRSAPNQPLPSNAVTNGGNPIPAYNAQGKASRVGFQVPIKRVPIHEFDSNSNVPVRPIAQGTQVPIRPVRIQPAEDPVIRADFSVRLDPPQSGDESDTAEEVPFLAEPGQSQPERLDFSKRVPVLPKESTGSNDERVVEQTKIPNLAPSEFKSDEPARDSDASRFLAKPSEPLPPIVPLDAPKTEQTKPELSNPSGSTRRLTKATQPQEDRKSTEKPANQASTENVVQKSPTKVEPKLAATKLAETKLKQPGETAPQPSVRKAKTSTSVIYAKRQERFSRKPTEPIPSAKSLKRVVKNPSSAMTPARFANPPKLPKISRSGPSKEIDLSNQMMTELPKSTLKPTGPVLVTQQPEGFKSFAVANSAFGIPKTVMQPGGTSQQPGATDSTEKSNSNAPSKGIVKNEYFKSSPTVSQAQLEKPVQEQQNESSRIRRAAAVNAVPTEAKANVEIEISGPQNGPVAEPLAPAELKKQIESMMPSANQQAAQQSRQEAVKIQTAVGTQQSMVSKPGAQGSSEETRFVNNPYVQMQNAQPKGMRPGLRQNLSRRAERVASSEPVGSATRKAVGTAYLASQTETMTQDAIMPQPGLDSTLNDPAYLNPNMMQPGYVNSAINESAFPRSPFAVFRAEAIYMTQSSNSVRFSDAFRMDPFDYEGGIRINAQRIFGVEGRSLTYTGLQEWNETVRANAGDDSLGIVFFNGGLATGSLAPFTNANFQQQYHKGSLHTIEWNTVTWGWDVLNLYWGLRASQYKEEFDFFSSTSDGQQGRLMMDFRNLIIGPQVGGEVYYDIGKIVSTGVKVKLGATANLLDRDTVLFSNGNRLIDNNDGDGKFNWLAELGLFARLRLGQRCFIRGGYDFQYNSDIYRVSENLPFNGINGNYGLNSISDSQVIHGATLGLEVLW